MMLQSNLMMGGRSDGIDRYRDWRLDVDHMSYEVRQIFHNEYLPEVFLCSSPTFAIIHCCGGAKQELLELGDRIGYVSTGLREDEISKSVRKSKIPVADDPRSRIHSDLERKCSICQVRSRKVFSAFACNSRIVFIHRLRAYIHAFLLCITVYLSVLSRRNMKLMMRWGSSTVDIFSMLNA